MKLNHTTTEIAAEFGINEDTVRRYCRLNKVPCVKFGNRYRSSIEAFRNIFGNRFAKQMLDRS